MRGVLTPCRNSLALNGVRSEPVSEVSHGEENHDGVGEGGILSVGTGVIVSEHLVCVRDPEVLAAGTTVDVSSRDLTCGWAGMAAHRGLFTVSFSLRSPDKSLSGTTTAGRVSSGNGVAVQVLSKIALMESSLINPMMSQFVPPG